jgi:hypothetical protein
MTKKPFKIAYYILTVLLSALMLFSAFAGLQGGPDAIALMGKLGYPMYVMTMLSVLKIFGVIGIWQTKWPTLREWAYAGFTFDLLGAGISFAAIGDVPDAIGPFIMIVVLVFGSYVCMKKMK